LKAILQQQMDALAGGAVTTLVRTAAAGLAEATATMDMLARGALESASGHHLHKALEPTARCSAEAMNKAHAAATLAAQAYGAPRVDAAITATFGAPL
jgi:hypothetical protein